MKTWNDPFNPNGRDARGPIRIITEVKEDPNGGATLITLDCGHVCERNQIYQYKIGSENRCFHCGPFGKK